MEALVLGIDNSLIPVEIGTCNEKHKYFTVKLHNLHIDQSELNINNATTAMQYIITQGTFFVSAVNFIDCTCKFYNICFAENNELDNIDLRC